MKKYEFYKYYIPALKKALLNENNWDQFEVKGPEYFISLSYEKQIEIENYLESLAGNDSFLDSIAYYFDAKAHGFDEIEGIDIEIYKMKIETEILKYCKKYDIE